MNKAFKAKKTKGMAEVNKGNFIKLIKSIQLLKLRVKTEIKVKYPHWPEL